ncbi:MAG: hypothetical protein ACLPVW_17665 [Terriglobales bacterium]
MRVSFLTVPILLVVAQLAAQQAPTKPPTVAAVLQAMNSSNLNEREKAFEEASKLLASRNTAASDVESLRLGMIQLLIGENDRNNISDEEMAMLAASASCGNGTDNCEGAGEEDDPSDDPSTAYMHRLIATVAGFNDERTIQALAGAVGWDENVTKALLAFGDKALGPVIDQLNSRNSSLRMSALDTAIAILEARNDAASQVRIRELIRSSLNDHRPIVRTHVVRKIDCRKDRQDFVPLLQEVAKTDPFKLPGKADDGGDGDEFYPVRADARRALRHIQNNELCTSWR